MKKFNIFDIASRKIVANSSKSTDESTEIPISTNSFITGNSESTISYSTSVNKRQKISKSLVETTQNFQLECEKMFLFREGPKKKPICLVCNKVKILQTI